jgi:Flp pilus assembly pilin Flp
MVIEYVLMCGLLALVGAALAVSVGNSISTAYNNIGAKQDQALGGGSLGQGDGGDGNGKGKGNSKH